MIYIKGYNMEWVIKALENSQLNKNKLRGVNQHKKETKRLKYCSTCKNVWENDLTYKLEIHHKSLPSYKLPRIKCNKCKRNKR